MSSGAQLKDFAELELLQLFLLSLVYEEKNARNWCFAEAIQIF